MSRAYQEAVLRGKQRTFSQFICDADKGEFFGRTFTSWLKIILFYNIYYGFLAVFFSICMFLFYTTLDPNMPKYIPGHYDSILMNPSLSFRPQPRVWDLHQDLIRYNAESGGEINRWEDELNYFMRWTYESESRMDNVIECSDYKTPGYNMGEICMFDIKELGPGCTRENGWGYRNKTPCVILKMNKMIGWVPDVYNDVSELYGDYMPSDLVEHMKQVAAENHGNLPMMVWLSCTQTDEDGENLDADSKISYFPRRGFPSYFFPYMNTPGYEPPLVALQFNSPPLNRRIDVECRAWAKNIWHNKKERLGMVRFSLLIEAY